MKRLVLPVCLVVLAGCSSASDTNPVAPLTADMNLNRRLAEMQVTSCAVGGLPSSKPGPVKARASTQVGSKENPGDPHHCHVSVYDPKAGTLKEADGDGNLLVPVGGAIVAVTGTAATAWFLHDKAKGGGGIDIAGEGGTPVSVLTKKPANPDTVAVTAKTVQGTTACTPIAATDEAVCATAPLTPADAGPVTISASQGGEPLGSEEVTAFSNSIEFVPATIASGQTGQLVGQFLPGGHNLIATFTITGAQQAPTPCRPATVTGGPGNYTVVFKGMSDQLSTTLLTVVGTDEPIQASVDVQEVK